MIKAEILQALPKLNAEERREIRAKLNELDSETFSIGLFPKWDPQK
jgi:hypothetical protein